MKTILIILLLHIIILCQAKEPPKLLKIENKPPAWWYSLTDDEQYQLLKEESKLLETAIERLERDNDYLSEIKTTINENNIILKKVFVPKFSIGAGVLFGISKNWQKDLYIFIPVDFYFFKRLQLEIIPAVKIFDTVGAGLGVALKFNF